VVASKDVLEIPLVAQEGKARERVVVLAEATNCVVALSLSRWKSLEGDKRLSNSP